MSIYWFNLRTLRGTCASVCSLVAPHHPTTLRDTSVRADALESIPSTQGFNLVLASRLRDTSVRSIELVSAAQGQAHHGAAQPWPHATDHDAFARLLRLLRAVPPIASRVALLRECSNDSSSANAHIYAAICVQLPSLCVARSSP
jgi:hypothetical protein